jgi:hypothetical protein
MKKISIILFCSLLCAATHAQSGTTGDLSWSISDGTLTISGTGAMPDYPWKDAPWQEYQNFISNVIIEYGISSIGNNAFNGCSNLTSVTIPNSVTYIGNYTFPNCHILRKVINHATTPQTIDASVFENIDKTACTLRVPAASVSAYQAADVWKEFQVVKKRLIRIIRVPSIKNRKSKIKNDILSSF